jgi:hypothetical protein
MSEQQSRSSQRFWGDVDELTPIPFRQAMKWRKKRHEELGAWLKYYLIRTGRSTKD